MYSTQYFYTYKFRYLYQGESVESYHYYCSNDYALSEQELIMIREGLYIEDGDVCELDYCIVNNFNSNTFLSDKIMHHLNGEAVSETDTQDYTAYIGFIISRLGYEDEAEYRKTILSEVWQNLEAKGINKSFVQAVVNEVGINLEDDNSIKTQLRRLIDSKGDEAILAELAPIHNIKPLRHHLNKMGKAYNFHKEESRYKIAVIFLAFMRQTDLLHPNLKGNITAVFRLLAQYYGIEPPQYRLAMIENYKDPKNGKPLIKHIKETHTDFWDNLP